MPPKKAGGRPRKYSTAEEARRANLEGNRRRRRLQQSQPMGPADFIAYEPQLHADIPAETPLETGLRISRDIRIPPDPNARQAEVRPNLRPSPRPNPQPPAAEDAEINEQVRRVQTREQETDAEQAERDAEIAEILLGMRAAEQTEDAGGGDVLETTNEAGAANALHISGLQTAARAEEERMSEEESQRSCFLNFGDIDEPILGDEQSIAASHASNRSVNIQRSIEGRVPPEAPARYASPSLQSSNKSSSKKGASRRSTAFPAQRNNLLSWMESLPGRPPSNLSSPAPTPISTRNASPSPFRPIEDFVPSTPAQSVREMPPAPATPIRASVPAASASPAPTERTAFKLAKQLRNFQGCTHEQHHEADQLHHEHHRRPDVHSECSSLQQITALLSGGYIGGTPLPNVLSSPKLIRPGDYNESDHEHSTYLSEEDEQLWSDAIILPALNKIIESSNIMQHYPASADIASLDSTAISAEGLARKQSAREQLIKHAIKPHYLDPLWSLILQIIDENPGFDRFQGATLFAHAKNTKLEFMDTGLAQAYDGWQAKWSEVADPQFYNKDRTFVDLAKQVTSEDSALLYDHIPEDHEAEVFLWKKCCLEAYAASRVVLNADGSHAKGSPKRTVYPWATMRDTVGQTMFASPHGQESRDGLIYSQFYGLIKTPFDSSKVYVFDNDSVENLALDPGYVRSLQQEGGGITFSKAVCEFGYLHSKKRAYANLVDNRGKSYGIREEHRISLTMMEEIYQQWQQWDLYDDEVDVGQPPLPYYIVPTQELLGFLSAQINKYCFLFEHVLAHTAMTYSLPETIVMVAALRALRFCYGSNLIQRESLLYKNRWEQVRGQRQIVKEGLGMRDAMERCGLGWFLPKFNWATWRLAPPHGENILRRWRAVKDLRDVYIRFNQAESWFDRYNWLEYLHALNLEQFDADRCPELTPGAVRQEGEIRFCYNGMRRMFPDQWLDEFFHLVRLTHWVLPYPSNAAFIATTKTSRTQGLKGRMMWFSAVYADPDRVELPFRSHPRTLYDMFWDARQQAFGDGRDQRAWSTSQLITACRAQGLKMHGQEETEEYWVVGKRSAGLKGFLPVWERTQPPRLRMLEQIKKKSLDELEDLMGGFSRDAAGDDIQDDPSDASGGEIGAGAVGDGDDRSQSRSAGTSRSIITVHDDGGRESVSRESASTPVTMSSGSIFVPSI
ncbi:hypothetical protein V8E51_011873 [Hyaloscypha variabilis]